MTSTNEKSAQSAVDFFLDITRDVCPFTFVRTKLLLERMAPGQSAEIRLRGAEPLANVPAAVRAQGHAVVALEPERDEAGDSGLYRLRIRKNPATSV
jgi:TusA-related sulfurtransferase